MKKMKYLFAGIFAFSVALGVNAQTVDYKEALKPITTALESSSNDPKVLKDLVKTYKKQFKKKQPDFQNVSQEKVLTNVVSAMQPKH